MIGLQKLKFSELGVTLIEMFIIILRLSSEVILGWSSAAIVFIIIYQIF